MKIYFEIKQEDLDSYSSFINKTRLPQITFQKIIPFPGYYCLDNTEHTCVVIKLEDIIAVPASFILKWDNQHISDLYENKIIGRFNEGKLQWTLMESDAIAPMIQVLMYGTKKYDRNNWKKACPKRLDLMDSLQRHSLKIIQGESVDPESGLPHIGHLMCNAMFYSYWEQKTNGQFENFVEPNK